MLLIYIVLFESLQFRLLGILITDILSQTHCVHLRNKFFLHLFFFCIFPVFFCDFFVFFLRINICNYPVTCIMTDGKGAMVNASQLQLRVVGAHQALLEFFKSYNTFFQNSKYLKNTYINFSFDWFSKQQNSSDFKFFKHRFFQITLKCLLFQPKKIIFLHTLWADFPQIFSYSLVYIHDQFSLQLVGNVSCKGNSSYFSNPI